MGLDWLISVLVAVTLIEMMIATGLGVRLADVTRVARNRPQLLAAGLTNYVAVPAAAVAMILLVGADPPSAIGILLLAVCPGPPYGPPLTSFAGGTTATAVGLMVILAGSSVVMAPLLLSFLLLLTTGSAGPQVHAFGMFKAIVVTQLLPLCCGLAISHRRPDLARRWLGPATAAGKILNAVTLALILTSQFPKLLDVRPGEIVGMLGLLSFSLAAGWSVGGRLSGNRKAMALTTSIRNVGLGLVIASSTFAGTPAVTTVVVYGLLQLLAAFLLALWWRHQAAEVQSDHQERAR
ncbi:bile acid:sodium symporter [Microvirga sp. BT688]|uniref:bile acid:sodium symporter family protein n=1 Tax=Microvirga sp. TaxID=1873136 RepID=UPI0016878ACE|nr:bile acid:sodium symporter [Microvirga sp.]MBD2748595.1 bile acid:sodium symporter [Microvirga sp.]